MSKKLSEVELDNQKKAVIMYIAEQLEFNLSDFRVGEKLEGAKTLEDLIEHIREIFRIINRQLEKASNEGIFKRERDGQEVLEMSRDSKKYATLVNFGNAVLKQFGFQEEFKL